MKVGPYSSLTQQVSYNPACMCPCINAHPQSCIGPLGAHNLGMHDLGMFQKFACKQERGGLTSIDLNFNASLQAAPIQAGICEGNEGMPLSLHMYLMLSMLA
eukprot:621919-Pelagomonas_calceolata.AAC.2